jgi:Raf kinase inhibitor-like YbhB/YbcL family protein
MHIVKFAARILLGFLVVLAAGVLVLSWRASRARDADNAYHAALAKTLVVKSVSFSANGEIPAVFTCKGGGHSPQVGWSRSPAGAMSYVVTMIDWDAPTPALRLNAVTHWILYNISPERSEIPDAATNEELRRENIGIGENSSGTVGYAPPCPPLGTHRYSVRVYALDVAQIRPLVADRLGIQDSMRGHILAFGETDAVAR